MPLTQRTTEDHREQQRKVPDLIAPTGDGTKLTNLTTFTGRAGLAGVVNAVLSLGRPIFSVAIIVLGVETVLCAGLVDTFYSRKYPVPIEVVPVIPWVPTALPWLAYVVGAALAACGIGLLFKCTLETAAIGLAAIMSLGALFLDLPNLLAHFGDMSIRTEVFEPLSIACLALLMSGLMSERNAVPSMLERTSRYLFGFALVVFGVDHFLALAPIGTLIPNWIPWHVFWIAFFGAGFIAAGLSIALDVLLPWGAGLFGLMFAIWVFTLHLPGVVGSPRDPDQWSSLMIAITLWTGPWVLARSRMSR